MTTKRLMMEKTVCGTTTFSRTTLNRKVAAGEFPAPIKISERRKAWDADLVENWVKDRLAEGVGA